MSKVVHLSDDAHTRAKNFCKQHGLKMSDWVADLIAEAIAEGRTAPGREPRLRPAVPAAPAPVIAPVVAAVPTPIPTANHIVHAPVVSNGPTKKKLERYHEDEEAPAEGVPPWAAPPFWAKAQR